MRSRVTPLSKCTIAWRLRRIALKSEDLPTFGRPTIAITGRLSAASETPASLLISFFLIFFSSVSGGKGPERLERPEDKTSFQEVVAFQALSVFFLN